MSPNTLKKLFLSQLFLFLPLIVFAQSNRTESVALVPFWGPDEQFIKEFGEELYKGVNEQQGFRSVIIDMTDLPDDVPEGGFPPYICPSPSLIKTNPIAITGEMETDEDDDELWILRLYLWEMADTRLVFSDRVQGYDREEIAAGLPLTLEWLFSWLKKGRAGSGSGSDTDIDYASLYGQGKQVFITTSIPLQWLYVGGRAGWTPARIQSAPDPDKRYGIQDYHSINAALSISGSVAPESVPFFSRFLLQADGIFNYDFHPSTDSIPEKFTTMSISPALLLKIQAYRHGNLLFTLFGGAYTSFALDNKTQYGSSFPIGWTAGATFGGKLDPIPGIFFFDVRFSMDLFDTWVKADMERYRRSAVTLCIGYEFGFITKK